MSPADLQYLCIKLRVMRNKYVRAADYVCTLFIRHENNNVPRAAHKSINIAPKACFINFLYPFQVALAAQIGTGAPD